MKITKRNIKKSKYQYSISNSQRQYLRSQGFIYESFSKYFQRIIDVENSEYKIIQEIAEYYSLERSDNRQPNNRIVYSAEVSVIKTNTDNNRFQILTETEIDSEGLLEIYINKKIELSNITEKLPKYLFSKSEKRAILEFFRKLNFAAKAHRKYNPIYDKENSGKEIEIWYKQKAVKVIPEFNKYDFPVIKRNMPFIYDNIIDVKFDEIQSISVGSTSLSYIMPEVISINRSKDEELNERIKHLYTEEVFTDGMIEIPIMKLPGDSESQFHRYSIQNYIAEIYNQNAYSSFSLNYYNSATCTMAQRRQTEDVQSVRVNVEPIMFNMKILEVINSIHLKFHDKISSFVKEIRGNQVYLYFMSFINPNEVPEDLTLEVIPEAVYNIVINRECLEKCMWTELPERIPLSFEQLIECVFDKVTYSSEENIEIDRCRNLEWNHIIEFGDYSINDYTYQEVPDVREKVNRRYFND